MFIRAPSISLPSRPVWKQFPCRFRPVQGESLFIRKCNSFQEADGGPLSGRGLSSHNGWWGPEGLLNGQQPLYMLVYALLGCVQVSLFIYPATFLAFWQS